MSLSGFKARRWVFIDEEGWDDVSQLPQITEGLARGYSDQDIEKILELNFLRVFKEVGRE